MILFPEMLRYKPLLYIFPINMNIAWQRRYNIKTPLGGGTHQDIISQISRDVHPQSECVSERWLDGEITPEAAHCFHYIALFRGVNSVTVLVLHHCGSCLRRNK